MCLFGKIFSIVTQPISFKIGEKIPAHDRKPNVPKVTDHIATPMRSRRNIVQKNALDVMISEPNPVENPQFVDAPNGTKQVLKASGMVPNFVEKKDFGKVPGYIKKIKKSKVEEQKKWEEEQHEIAQRREMMKLQDGERDALLQVKKTIFPLSESLQSFLIHLDSISKNFEFLVGF